ncbi:hypothetical protein [Dokdonia sp.]|uniref:hypothetical protein n=1 Tax=Dokdonia sp. TaxID=2024995 RepID=UPI0032669D95
MRNICVLFCCFLLSQINGQTEFKEYENGLIYSLNAISKLTEIVGEKNEEFRTCDLTKSFASTPQTKGYVFEIDESYKQTLREDVEGNISLDAFLSKYKEDKGSLYLIIKSKYTNYKEEKYIRFDMYPDENSLQIPEEEWESSRFGSWIVNFSHQGDIDVLYVTNEFETQELPDTYKKMVQYSECLIDSTTTVFKENASRNRFRNSIDDTLKAKKQKQFFKFIEEQIGVKEPDFEDYELKNGEINYKKYRKAYVKYEEKKETHITSYLYEEPQFLKLLNETYEESVENGSSTNEIETYVAKYLSKAKALELKRSRVVMGTCSMDTSPRIHAMNISQLSAESYNWDVFLRAHLNIMNDRFERASDGSYAWEQRHTYIKELEVLQINVPDLLLGMSFRVSNPSKNHYYGSINRLGRAIAESKDLDTFETIITKAIKDQELDDFNRLLMFYLYGNLRYHLDKNAELDFDRTLINEKAKLLPEYLVKEGL